MKRMIALFICASLIPLNGAFAHEPAVNQSNLTIISLQSTGVVSVSASDERTLTVTHEVRDGDVYVECFIDGFLFSEEKAGTQHQEGEGHFRLYVDDEHIDTLYQAAFIVKGLSSGDHDIQVVIVKNDRTPYDLEKAVQVHI